MLPKTSIDFSQAQQPAPYDPVAAGYDETRHPDFRLTAALTERLQSAPKAKILDVGCGTGNYLAELSRQQFNMVGLDLSKGMLNIARTKSPSSEFVHASAENMPINDEQFSGAISCLAIHHFKDLEKMAHEVFRVLKPGSRFVIFTTEPSQIKTFWLNEYFGRLIEASEGLMPPLTRIITVLRKAGFATVNVDTWDIPEDMVDLFLFGAKHQPEQYLRPEVRQGITRFRDASSDFDVTGGCDRLQSDIQNGRFDEVLAKYPSVCGDYTFLTAVKNP